MKLSIAEAQADGSLLRSEPFSYLYSEWDFRSGSYRSRWCRVRERVMVEGTSDFYTETLAEHRPLVAQVTGRFEHYLPELFRKVTRCYDGEDLHLDGVIERVHRPARRRRADGENLLAARAHATRRRGGTAARHERDDR